MELLNNRSEMQESIKRDPRLRRILLVKIVSLIEHMTRWETTHGRSAYQDNGSMDPAYAMDHANFIDTVWQEIERFGTCKGTSVSVLYPMWCKTMVDLGFEKDFDFLLKEPEADKKKLEKMSQDYSQTKERKNKLNQEIIKRKDGSSTTPTP